MSFDVRATNHKKEDEHDHDETSFVIEMKIETRLSAHGVSN
ncbi:hypothetical protein LCGC14_3049140 [marine sediment metagenome]|uniref:Uncharacterized protein n=1 Tax=marine sediment metagenome TaxID=412755 RepID=A0A0F8YV74_9ZZZZ